MATAAEHVPRPEEEDDGSSSSGDEGESSSGSGSGSSDSGSDSESGSDSGSDSDTGDSGSSSSDAEDDDEEPKLKYHRLGASVAEIFKAEMATCMAASGKFLVLGTDYGNIFVLDSVNGTEALSFRSAHSERVNDISIDQNGEFIASCADDGKVVIRSLYDQDNVTELTYDRPVKSVAIDPWYSKSKKKQVCTGGLAGELVLSEKSWGLFGSHKKKILHAGEGPIHDIEWRGIFIAWANDLGVKIYDTSSQQRITYIDRFKDSPRPDLYRCRLKWKDDTTLFIGWANSVKVGVIKEKQGGLGGRDSSAATNLPSRYLELVAMFQTDFWVSGLAPFDDNLVALAFTEEEEEMPSGRTVVRSVRPELRILSYRNEELSSDILSIHGFEQYMCNDYHLEFLPDEKLFYVVSPRDIVVAKPRDLDDHVRWLLDHDRYEEAMVAAEGNEKQLRTLSMLEIRQQYLADLVNRGDFERAAINCPMILGTDAVLWEKWICSFAKLKQLRAINKYIPVDNPRLSRTVYEMVLNSFLQTDYAAFQQTVREWSTDLYDVEKIIPAVRAKIEQDTTINKLAVDGKGGYMLHTSKADKVVLLPLPCPGPSEEDWSTAILSAFRAVTWSSDFATEHHRRALHKRVLKYITHWGTSNVVEFPASSEILNETLGELYACAKQYDKALHIYLTLGRGEVFSLIETYDLFHSILDKTVLLMEFDSAKAVQLMVRNPDRIPPEQVLTEQLKGHPRFQYQYLEELWATNQHLAKHYGKLHVQLTAEYNPKGLMNFLRSNNFVPLKDAMEICEQRMMVPEQVFLLQRMGDINRALMLIINELEDVEMAIQFALEENDEDLWDKLIQASMQRPAFIKGLLNNVGTHINPIRIVRSIPKGLEVDGLRDSLVKILQDFNLQIELRKGCTTILTTDCISLLQKLNGQQKRAMAVRVNTACCSVCNGQIAGSVGDSEAKLAVFRCGHVYHQRCLTQGAMGDTGKQPAAAASSGEPELFCTLCRSASTRGRPGRHR